MNDIFGQDIKLDESGQALVAANGELLLTDGEETGSQDIRLRLFTPLGNLFYDKEFGSKIHEWIREENTEERRLAFCTEAARRIRLDPRVKSGTTSCEILAWDEQGITARVSWEFITENHVYNLVIQVGADMEMVISDVNPG